MLVADDHPLVRRGLATLLATANDLELVGMASDGAEAVELAVGSGADVVVMDLSMPEVDGVAAIKDLASRAPSCRVLVLTSFSDQARVSDALRAGADGYLLKHAEPEDILDGIREVVRGGSPLDPTAARILLNTSRSHAGAADMLTAREREVLIQLEAGLNNRQIARKLDIAERTVKSHLHSIFQRLGVTHRTEAALWAQRNL
ncbi:MAG TPA: response regulator transcription factor [Actinophytocola sp.]|nr:response regulator transcription factor [Actinophytocola sp.]